MIAFELYLINRGFVRHFYNFDKHKWEPTSRYAISSMMDILYFYVKGDIGIAIGLNEKDRPPTLIHPRPKIELIRNGVKHTEIRDDTMNAVLGKFDHEYIYNRIINREVIHLEINDGNIF